jgi:penicillin amidase
LPQLEGERPLAGLVNPVRIARDALGVPTIRAANRIDAARSMGFLHAQERFFQMDLLRRSGAGELAELFGQQLVAHDEAVRRRSFRDTAREAVERLPDWQRTLLQAYTEGVNAGLQALGVRPPEYLLIRSRPVAWRPEDSLLVSLAMFLTLQDSTGAEERAMDVAARALPPEAFEFFFPRGSEWEAALDGSRLATPPLPGPDAIDFSREGAALPATARAWAEAYAPGSNSWGIEGSASATGSAIIANDMHLDLSLPNTWYRACMEWTNDRGEAMRMIGVTLPGVPVFAVASNGHIAWAFTNAYLDTTDIVRLELDPRNPSRYRAPDGWREIETVHETLAVYGEPDHRMVFERTIWGPILPDPDQAAKRAVCWIPQISGVLNLDILELENARTVAEAMDIAPRCGAVPVQNFLVGDREGALGWTLIGRLPKRVGWDGRLSVSWADGTHRWEGWIEGDVYPRLMARPGQSLWTANNRITGTPEYLRLGPWDADIGARAGLIRDRLAELSPPLREEQLVGIFADDRAVFLDRWQKLLLRTLASADAGTNSARWTELRGRVENWGARAAVDSVGYRMVRGFRLEVMARILEPVVTRCEVIDPDVDVRKAHHEQPVWTILQERPAHLLNPRFASYEALLSDAIQGLLTNLEAQAVPIAEATWGRRNVVRIQHPISLAAPALARWLDLPPVALPGDNHMPRVQAERMGASERLIVSPGHEESGVFHMPGGQSGHFLSSYYRAGHEAWMQVAATPLLPGIMRHTLVLRPP